MKFKLILLFVVFASFIFGQKEANVWHFGIGYSLDFNSGSPVQTSGSQILTFEGCTSYCDKDGNLLFYSNGGGRIPSSGQDPRKIWNKNNQVKYDMQGTEGGGWSAAVLIGQLPQQLGWKRHVREGIGCWSLYL